MHLNQFHTKFTTLEKRAGFRHQLVAKLVFAQY